MIFTDLCDQGGSLPPALAGTDTSACYRPTLRCVFTVGRATAARSELALLPGNVFLPIECGSLATHGTTSRCHCHYDLIYLKKLLLVINVPGLDKILQLPAAILVCSYSEFCTLGIKEGSPWLTVRQHNAVQIETYFVIT